MKERRRTFIALLRGINVGGHNKVPMSELRALCGKLGWSDVQSYIQSGNVVFTAASTTMALEAQLERGIEKRFGLSVAVIVRAASAWPDYVTSNPFPEASEKEPNLVMLSLPKSAPKPDAARALSERAANGERIVQVGDAIWVHFSGGVVARSKLSPALVDRLVGCPVTARNWRTVLKLGELAGA